MFKRAQPWLGTLVSLQVEGLAAQDATGATNAAFEEIQAVHRLMSFHDPSSDVSRLNAHRASHPVAVHPYTYRVLQRALEISTATAGCFDVTIGAELISHTVLPYRTGWQEGRAADWSQIELLDNHHIRLHHPVCLDLGGIAKGFAVDKAMEVLQSWGAEQAMVNAGGDLRVMGDQAEWVALAAGIGPGQAPVLAVENCSVASSAVQSSEAANRTLHVNGRSRMPVTADRFACVISPECLVADALTKVVLAQGAGSSATLEAFSSQAYLYQHETGWQSLGCEDHITVPH